MEARNISPAQLQRVQARRKRYDESFKASGMCCLVSIYLFLAFLLALAGSEPIIVRILFFLMITPLGIAVVIQIFTFRAFSETWMECLDCHNRIPILRHWVCGHCLRVHTPGFQLIRQLSDPTFVEPCANCKMVPPALYCPFCESPVVFYKTDFERNPTYTAYCEGKKPPPPKPPEPEPVPPPVTLETLIPIEDRQLHTLIVGSTGSGKTEAMKRFVHSLLSQPAAGIVIDPHGDIAEEIAHWPNDRLVYVRHDLASGYAPTINPFEIHGIEPADVSSEALAVKKVIAQQLLGAFQEVTAAGEKSELTKNMQTVLMPCILTLLDLEGATIRDLQRFVDDQRNSTLVTFGRSRDHYPDVKEFFTYNFVNKAHLRTTKDAILTKLQDLLSTGFFADLTCAKSTISLEQEWNDRKIVVLNLSAGTMGDRESAAFGRLVLSMLQGIAVRRADIDKGQRVPCHCFIDEAYLFISPSITKIMRQSRKYGLILTLAAQQVGQMSKELETAILDSAHLQIVGVTKPPNYRSTATTFHLNPDDLPTLHTGRFLVRTGNKEPRSIKFSAALVGNKGAMPPEAWEATKRSQIKRYYRSTVDTGAAEKLMAEVGKPRAKPEDDPFNVDRV